MFFWFRVIGLGRFKFGQELLHFANLISCGGTTDDQAKRVINPLTIVFQSRIGQDPPSVAEGCFGLDR